MSEASPVGTVHAAHDESSTLPGEGRSFLLDELIPGTIAGLLGGTVLLVIYMGGTWVFGTGPWDGPKGISSLLYRDVLLHDMGTANILVGLGLFYAVSCGMAFLFALALPRHVETQFATLSLAMFYAAAMYVVMVYFIAPWATPVFAAGLIHALWFVGMLAWAACLGFIEPTRSRQWVESRWAPGFVRRESHGRLAANSED
jgi:hypothetical protein